MFLSIVGRRKRARRECRTPLPLSGIAEAPDPRVNYFRNPPKIVRYYPPEIPLLCRSSFDFAIVSRRRLTTTRRPPGGLFVYTRLGDVRETIDADPLKRKRPFTFNGSIFKHRVFVDIRPSLHSFAV